jgi:hypothetical protein
MKAIFLSYRRADKWAAIHLGDTLQQMIPEVSIFRDTRSIHAGEEWARSINNALDTAEVMLAVIGPGWLDSLKEKERDPKAADWVLYEIRHALEKKIRVIPVLMGEETAKPRRQELPEEIQGLLDRQWIRVTDAHLEEAVETLAAEIRAITGVRSPVIGPKHAPVSPPARSTSKRGLWIVLGVVGAVVVIGVGLFFLVMTWLINPSLDIPAGTQPGSGMTGQLKTQPFTPVAARSVAGMWWERENGVLFRLDQAGNSVILHLVDSVNGASMPVANLVMTDGKLSGQVNGLPLELQLSADGNTLAGTIRGVAEEPVLLERQR